MIDKFGNEDCSHEQHERCPMSDERCGCYVGREVCLKAERDYWAEQARVAFNETYNDVTRGG